MLSQLADVTKRPSKLVELLGHVIAFQFDLHMSMLAAMPTPVWKASRLVSLRHEAPVGVVSPVPVSVRVRGRRSSTSSAASCRHSSTTRTSRSRCSRGRRWWTRPR